MTIIDYATWTAAGHARRVPAEMAADADAVCEVGAGANPLLLPRPGYVLLDVSPSELAKAGGPYSTVVADICAPDFDPPGSFDLVFSLSTAEHVRDARLFHSNVRRLLKDGGRAVHFFPTLYSLPFVVNRILPERLSEPLLHVVTRGRDSEGSNSKFPARYEWCRGPSRRQIARLESCGFTVERYSAFFGNVYYRRLGLEPVVARAAKFLVQHPIPALTSFALVVLRAR